MTEKHSTQIILTTNLKAVGERLDRIVDILNYSGNNEIKNKVLPMMNEFMETMKDEMLESDFKKNFKH